MHVDEVAAHEALFDEVGKDTSGTFHRRAPKQVTAPGSTTPLDYVEVRPTSGDRSYYTAKKVAKDQIVLHFTAGYLRSDVAMLTRPGSNLSVPFLIGRNGKVYNLFPSGEWAYHLGPDAVGGNQVRSPATLGIELSNIGPLTRQGNNLITNLSRPGKPDIYCTMDEAHAWVHAPFRGYDYYATHTGPQVDALIAVLRYLLATYDLPARLLHPSQRYETLAGVPGFRGIVTHVNYRKEGKSDIGPGFDWDRLAAGIGATIADRI
jgi:N-acetylmuramoyl-L-alanine amidase